MTNVSLQCPQCHRMDNVQKVSAIFSAGTSTSTYTGYAGGVGYTSHGPVFVDENIYVSGNRQTTLSRLLSPPVQPTDYNPVGIGFIVLVILLSIPVVLVLLELILDSMNPFSPDFIRYVSNLNMGTISLCCAITLICLFSARRGTNEARRVWAKAQMPHWQRAIAKWQQLYYCHRCDGVFLLGQMYLVPTSMVNDFIHRE